jgi:CubicO group peptidase (beta-lactamase class C family)
MKLFRSRWAIAAITVVSVLVWAALVVAGTVYGWGHRALATPGDSRAFVAAAKQLIETRNRGNVAFRLIEGGSPRDEYFVSVGDPVGRETLFQVASLSKWVTAWAVMTLVESGKIDLDAPVSRYLTRWHLPASEFDNDGVTVRRLLSHTAGLTDGLGFAGYPPGAEIPSLEATLDHPDASPGHSGVIRVGAQPGSRWQYSGGGYLILQLLIEEVTHESFEAYVRRAIFDPLEMERSTFSVDASTPDVATFYDVDGSKAIHYGFRAKAATSLYTNVADMTRFVPAHFEGPANEPAGRGVLSPDTLRLMRRPEAASLGADIWGLGVMLYAPVGNDDFVIGHDGNNDPAINTAVRLNPTNGDGIVVLETGDHTLASALAGEWVYWQTGMLDFIMLTMAARSMVSMIVAGGVVIVLIGLVLGFRVSRPAAS